MGLLVNVGTDWSPAIGRISTSKDALTWTNHDSSIPAGFRPHTVATSKSMIVVGGNIVDAEWWVVPSFGAVLTSPDGVAWTQRDPMLGDIWHLEKVIWAEGLGLFVAVGDNRKVSTSPDGVNWTARFVDMENVNAPWPESPVEYPWIATACWAPELGLLIVGGYHGCVATSPDGINWTRQPRAGSYFDEGDNETEYGGWTILDIEWSPQLGLFAMAAYDHVATSPDGLTWTAVTPVSTASAEWVAWSPYLGMFRCNNYFSYDGIDWAVGTTGTTARWWAVWVPGWNVWIGAGWPGTNDITSSPDGLMWTVLSTDIYTQDCAVFGKMGGIPAMRQRQRDDGLTTDAKQQKGQGSSLQTSQRRGGRVYY